MRTLVIVVAICSVAVAGHFCKIATPATVAESVATETTQAAADAAASVNSNTLILHEWGTFTSFAGSNGVPIGFPTNNADLPQFVYHHSGDAENKSNLLARFGTISMETPVMYFYTPKEVQASVRVDFPKGWITEWYPHASTAPDAIDLKTKRFGSKPAGETISWNVKLLPGQPVRFPREAAENPYYHARETDAVPLLTTFDAPPTERNDVFHGGTIAQSEKFLFYRGVGSFPPPVTVRAEGGGKVRVTNAAGETVTGMVLLVVRNGQIGYQALHELESGAEIVAKLPEPRANVTDLVTTVANGLIAAGLYEREAQAMVKTWEAAWFKEEGIRLLYIVPRRRTDELLPLAVDPLPKEVVRVIVGRHDFLTPELEVSAERHTERIQAARAELAAAQAELAKLGRFSEQARQMAAQRLTDKMQK